jgi:hypothetical protein
MTKTILFLFTALLGSVPLHAQLQKVLHRPFETDSAQVIVLDLYGEYQVQPWAGDNILVEMTVKLYQASDGLLKHFIEKEKRYEMDVVREGEVFKLVSKDKKREPIKTPHGECFETVEMRIFLPDRFDPDGDHRWKRKAVPGEAEKQEQN